MNAWQQIGWDLPTLATRSASISLSSHWCFVQLDSPASVMGTNDDNGVGKAIIDQYNNPTICLRANDPTGCLLQAVEPWILVSIGKTADILTIKTLIDQVIL